MHVIPSDAAVMGVPLHITQLTCDRILFISAGLVNL
jgi:hypothetical protein